MPKYITEPLDLHLWIGDSWCSPEQHPSRKYDSPDCIDILRPEGNYLNYTNLTLTQSYSWQIDHLPIPKSARDNGTVYLTAILAKGGWNPMEFGHPKKGGTTVPNVRTDLELTKYLPVRTFGVRSLLNDSESNDTKSAISYGEVRSHWKGRVKLRVVTPKDKILKDPVLTPDLWRWPTYKKNWLPYFYADETTLFRSHYTPLSNDTSKADPPLSIEFLPTSIGSFRLLTTVQNAIGQMQSLGLSEADQEEVMYMLAPERLFRMLLTWVISMLHMVFSFMAFKNEVGFWSGRETVAGLSQSTVIGEAVCSIIVFLFILDSDHTSRVVLITVGMSTMVDIWKVTKILKVHWEWMQWPSLKADNAVESKTKEYDVQGIRYLSIALLPLMVGWSIYCLFNYKYKSWYSWCISSAANGVYAFGFVLMTPQIFINYKLKSVAHLPWRALMYKAFNTFVDDAFAWIIEMPTAHRLATLRDDLVFFVYIYQRFLYPVDKTRANEFGFAYEEKPEGDQKEKKNRKGNWFFWRRDQEEHKKRRGNEEGYGGAQGEGGERRPSQ